MQRNTTPLIIAAFIGAVLLLGLLRFQPWAKQPIVAPPTSPTRPDTSGTTVSDARQLLQVGFLPVTCHLTCPVTDFATKTSGANRFESERFTDFPTMAESIKAGKLDATFMIAPLAMKLRAQGIPIKIVYLGHRDGSTVMVRKDDPATSLRDLKGKTFAVPSHFSNQYLVIRKLMKDQGVADDEITFIDMPPPEMPGALAAKAIDAYFVGEPFAAKAELDGTGRVLYFAKDIWPHFISCVLVVTEKLIKEKPEMVRDLVRGIADSGEWAETHRSEAAKVASPYYRQNEKVVAFVLNSPGRVSYRMLTPTDADIDAIERLARQTGVLEKDVPASELVDRSFIPNEIKPAVIDMTDAGKPVAP